LRSYVPCGHGRAPAKAGATAPRARTTACRPSRAPGTPQGRRPQPGRRELPGSARRLWACH
jgi:hypothetical protein